MLGIENADVVFRTLEAAVFVRDLHLGDLRLEIAVLRVRLLHVVDQLGKFILARIEVFQRVHHHARAVVVVLIVFWVDFIVRHGEVFAHCLFIFREGPDAVQKRVGDFVVRLDDAQIVAQVQRRAALGHERVGRDLACIFHLIIIEVQRELEGACRDHHVRLVPVVAFLRDGVIVADGKILLRQIVFCAEVVKQRGKTGRRVFFRCTGFFGRFFRRRLFCRRFFLQRRDDDRHFHHLRRISGKRRASQRNAQADGKQDTENFSQHDKNTSRRF